MAILLLLLLFPPGAAKIARLALRFYGIGGGIPTAFEIRDPYFLPGTGGKILKVRGCTLIASASMIVIQTIKNDENIHVDIASCANFHWNRNIGKDPIFSDEISIINRAQIIKFNLMD